MRIIHMIEGEVIKEVNLKSRLTRFSDSPYFDMTASKYKRRVVALIERRCDFVESGIEFDDKRGDCWWFIWWTGDNCLKFYPEGLII